jgi:hypothetical protein
MKKLAVISSLFVVSSLMGATYDAPSTSTMQNTPMGTPVNTAPSSPSGQKQVIQSPSGNSYMNSRPIEAEKADPKATIPETTDRFTSTDDHKLGGQIRVQIAEIIGAPKANAVFLVIDSGDVKLIGKVPTEDAKAKIVTAIHQVKGVKSINNKLEVEKK